LFPVIATNPTAKAATQNAASIGTTKDRALPGTAAKKGRGTAKKSPKAAAGHSTEGIKARLFELRTRGFNRLYQHGQIFEFSTPESLLDVNFAEPLLVLVDRIAIAADSRARVVDAAEIGFR